MHMHLLSIVTQGFPPINTVPPVHICVEGMQGWGVSTPIAAAVAAATCGFARLEHIPQGLMFAIGAASVICSIGLPSAITVALFVDVSVAGVVPNVHMHDAPVTTIGTISFYLP